MMERCKTCNNYFQNHFTPMCVTCQYYQERNAKPMTNGDRNRAMSDEKFAAWLGGHLDCEVCPARAHCANGLNCTDSLLNWLKQPAEVTE